MPIDISSEYFKDNEPAGKSVAEQYYGSEPPPDDPKPDKRKFVTQGRDQWDKFLSLPVETDGDRKLKDIIYDVAKKTGVRPDTLFASAMEEGLQQQRSKDGKKIVFSNDSTGKYIDAYAQLGIDDWENNLNSLKQGGYLKKDIPWQKNERVNDAADPKDRRTVKSAYFNTLEDALYAKAAFMLRGRDKVQQYAKQNNIKLSDDAVDFVTMQSYNGGDGIIPVAMKKYKEQGLLDGEKFLTNEPSGGYENNQTYYNSRKRYDPIVYMRSLGTFKDYPTYQSATTAPVAPPQGTAAVTPPPVAPVAPTAFDGRKVDKLAAGYFVTNDDGDLVNLDIWNSHKK